MEGMKRGRPDRAAGTGESGYRRAGKRQDDPAKHNHGALAQLVARYIRIVEVSGSNPLCSTSRKPLKSLDFEGFLYSFFILLF